MAILPENVLREVDNLFYLLWSITAPDKHRHLWPRQYVCHKDPHGLLNLAQLRVYNAIERSRRKRFRRRVPWCDAHK